VLTISYGNIKKIDSFVQVFYISLFNTATLLLACLATGNLSLHFTCTGLISTVLVALVSTVFGMVAFQAGLKTISPTAATILSTSEVLTSLMIGILFLGETLTWYQAAGSMLIVLSVIAVAFSEKKESKKMAVPTMAC
jgi:drug/metabolite transporter (DMT)-like permease